MKEKENKSRKEDAAKALLAALPNVFSKDNWSSFSPFSFFSTKLLGQLAFSITAFVFAVEGVILVFSIQTREKELYQLQSAYHEHLLKTGQGKSLASEHPHPFDNIEEQLNKFRWNVTLLSILISFVVVIGTLTVFHYIAGRHIRLLTLLDKNSHNKNDKTLIQISPEMIPNNELGELIQARNEMLLRVQDYEQSLEENLETAKQSLTQAAKLATIGELTATLVHDIRNPLMSIIASVSISRKRVEKKGHLDKEELLKIFTRIEKATNNVLSMVERMGRGSRRGEQERQIYNLNVCIANSLEFLQSKIYKNNVKIINQTSDFEMPSYVDPVSIEQVFSNLISNATDAMEKSVKREIHIKASFENFPARWLISICDTGSGIAKENLENIFTSFFTTKEVGKGTGLGLSSSHRIITDHDGEIYVESTIGEGTTFHIVLPAYQRNSRLAS